MRVGAWQIDITPPVGVELSGFLGRTQPGTGILDPLYARALLLEDGPRRLLWVHADLLCVPRSLVRDLREWAQRKLSLGPAEVMVSATHNHCGPATMLLNQCGQVDVSYLQELQERLAVLALQAAGRMQPCSLVTAEGRLELAVDRRKAPSAATDPRVGALGWRNAEGRFVAVALNYSMHPVALGPSRVISAEWPGQAAAELARQLPGQPAALVSSGACGNLNPPRCGASVEQMCQWGRQVAGAVRDLLLAAPQEEASLKTASRAVSLPLEKLTQEQIDECADGMIASAKPGPWKDRLQAAVEDWRRSMKRAVPAGLGESADVELFAAAIGPAVLVGVSAETFCQFTELVRRSTGRDVYAVGCANGMIGYLPHRQAYEEGGYEVASAHVFYNTFRPRPGSLELLAEQASQLVRTLVG